MIFPYKIYKQGLKSWPLGFHQSLLVVETFNDLCTDQEIFYLPKNKIIICKNVIIKREGVGGLSH